MPLTDEQAKYIKEQILKQIESYPEEKKAQIKQYISSMNNEQLEAFVIKNNLVKQPSESKEEDDDDEDGETSEKSEKSENQCIMCLLSSKQIESLPLYEDKDYLAVLELNPFSQGHTMLIPKKHIKEAKSLPSKAFAIANKIGRHLVKKLKAENFQINSSDELKHALINIIPVYKGEKLTYERKPAKKQDLQDLAMKIGSIAKKTAQTKAPKAKSNPRLDKSKVEEAIIKLPRRIP